MICKPHQELQHFVRVALLGRGKPQRGFLSCLQTGSFNEKQECILVWQCWFAGLALNKHLIRLNIALLIPLTIFFFLYQITIFVPQTFQQLSITLCANPISPFQETKCEEILNFSFPVFSVILRQCSLKQDVVAINSISFSWSFFFFPGEAQSVSPFERVVFWTGQNCKSSIAKAYRKRKKLMKYIHYS